MIVITALCALLISTPADANRTSKKLHRILDEVLETYQQMSPQTATYLGDKTRAGELDDVSADFYAQQNARLQPLLDQLQQLPANKLDFQDQISLQMQKAFLQETIADNQFREYEMPITAEGSFHVQLATMHRYASFNNKEDFENLT